LDPDDIMVLDAGDEVYLWIGNGSIDEEKSKSLEMVHVIVSYNNFVFKSP
jgi:gelsolin